jgi:uncharacterized OB-fold protein
MTLAKRPPDSLFQLVTDRWTQPFWDAAREGRLAAPRCASCGSFRMPPTPFCPHCRSQEIDWVTLSGKGVLYSYTTVARAIVPEAADHVPYVAAVIELPDAGGVRLVSNMVECEIEQLAIGMPVTVLFDGLPDGVAVPRFRPA